ncbi:MAG: hypothetical protein KDK34_05405 [Leptospiraceae bacterium]|nr:hypothetical protein [Leptospiraceae bacterium]
MDIMKFVRWSVYGLGIAIALILIVSFFLAPQIKYTEIRTVACSPQRSWNLVNDLSEWKLWSPWHKNRSSVRVPTTDAEKTVGQGAREVWPGPSGMMGIGITESIDRQRVVFAVTHDDVKNLQGSFDFEIDQHSANANETHIKLTLLSKPAENPMQRLYYHTFGGSILEAHARGMLDGLSAVCSP